MGGEEKGQGSRRTGTLTVSKQTSLRERGSRRRTGEAGGKRADRHMLADVRGERAAVGQRRATWEGGVRLYERTKIGHGCLGKNRLSSVTRQLTPHPVVVVEVVVGGPGAGEGERRRERRVRGRGGSAKGGRVDLQMA